MCPFVPSPTSPSPFSPASVTDRLARTYTSRISQTKFPGLPFRFRFFECGHSESAVLPIKLPKNSSESLLLPKTSDDPKFSRNSSPNTSEILTSFLLGATSPLQSLRIRRIFAVFPSVQAYDAREWLGSSYNFLYLPEVYKRLIFLHQSRFY